MGIEDTFVPVIKLEFDGIEVRFLLQNIRAFRLFHCAFYRVYICVNPLFFAVFCFTIIFMEKINFVINGVINKGLINFVF